MQGGVEMGQILQHTLDRMIRLQQRISCEATSSLTIRYHPAWGVGLSRSS